MEQINNLIALQSETFKSKNKIPAAHVVMNATMDTDHSDKEPNEYDSDYSDFGNTTKTKRSRHVARS